MSTVEGALQTCRSVLPGVQKGQKLVV